MTSAHILTRTPQGPFLLDASASTAVWRERRSSPNVWDFVPNDQRSGSRASDTGIPGSGTTTVTVGRASPCRGAAPRRSPPTCSQYSAAEFPQRGDNPGTWRGSTPRGSRDRELQTHQVGKGRVAWRQTTGRRRLIGTGDALSAGLSEAGWGYPVLTDRVGGSVRLPA